MEKSEKCFFTPLQFKKALGSNGDSGIIFCKLRKMVLYCVVLKSHLRFSSGAALVTFLKNGSYWHSWGDILTPAEWILDTFYWIKFFSLSLTHRDLLIFFKGSCIALLICKKYRLGRSPTCSFPFAQFTGSCEMFQQIQAGVIIEQLQKVLDTELLNSGQ